MSDDYKWPARKNPNKLHPAVLWVGIIGALVISYWMGII